MATQDPDLMAARLQAVERVLVLIHEAEAERDRIQYDEWVCAKARARQGISFSRLLCSLLVLTVLPSTS
jgi:hypothetical protein